MYKWNNTVDTHNWVSGEGKDDYIEKQLDKIYKNETSQNNYD